MSEISILVAGAAGQVASALAKAQAPDGMRVITVGRPQLDITDRDSVNRMIDLVRPGLVINAAAYTAVDQAESDELSAYDVNERGAGILAEAAAASAAPILHLSTDYVFNGEKTCAYSERDPVAPLGVYGRSKLAGEVAVAAANPQYLIFRTAWVYSPVGKNFAKTMLRVAGSRAEIPVVDDQLGNPTSAADIAAALWQVVSRIADPVFSWTPGVYHMAGSGEASWADFAEEIFKVSAPLGGPHARVQRIPSSDYATATRRPSNSRLDCTKLSDAFGAILPHWQTSTRACVEELVKKKGWSV